MVVVWMKLIGRNELYCMLYTTVDIVTNITNIIYVNVSILIIICARSYYLVPVESSDKLLTCQIWLKSFGEKADVVWLCIL